MSPSNTTSLDHLLATMWQDYITLNPDARHIHDLFSARGETVENDHIALRTYDVAPVNLDALAKPFLANGYMERGHYTFPTKHLRARHYEAPGRPKVFISELKVAEMPAPIQQLIHGLVAQVDPASLQRIDFCVSGRPWTLDFTTYQALAEVSEYAAWVAAIGFRPNHFTVFVNHLQTLASLEAVNDLLQRSGFTLNTSGGAIKGTPAQLLEQSSVLANTVELDFEDGRHTVPGCYYEFARRYPDASGSLYQGFIAASADRIFESTDRR